MNPVKLGIVGCGVIGNVHMRTAAESSLIDVVAVADIRAEAAQAAASQFGIESAYAQVDDLFADSRVEAVVLGLPAFARTELALEAFAHGKHVLTEKPVAMNAGEVERMIEARGELIAGCTSSRFRCLPSAEATARFIATGSLGELRAVHCRALKAVSEPPQTLPPNWRLSRSLNGGGIMPNWGCYDLDYLLGLTDWKLRPKTVLAQTWRIAPQLESHVAPGSDAETHVIAHIRCEGGEVISLERGECVAAESEEAWRIIGSKGSLRLRMTPSKAKSLIFEEATPDRGLISKVIWEGDEDYSAVHRGVLEDFALAVREGRLPKTSLEQALVVQRITDAIYASASRGRAVTLDSLR